MCAASSSPSWRRRQKQLYSLTNLTPREPLRSVFEIPADYPVIDQSEQQKKPMTKNTIYSTDTALH